MRELTIEDIDELTLGATLLGTGGGGDPYIARLMVRQAIEDFGPVQVVAASDLPPDGRILTIAVIGAPTAIVEKIPAGTEFIGAKCTQASRSCGWSKFGGDVTLACWATTAPQPARERK